MKNLLRTALLLILISSMAFAILPRVSTFAPPDTNMNVGGMGAMVAGVDVDGDGATEIYLINDNWNDSDAGELIPRIYKLERAIGDTNYQVVWEANAQDFDPTIMQNTWPVLSLTDLDNDGKMELTWGIVNFNTTPSPYRIWVYEHAGGDNFGIQNPTTLKWEPHSVWTIADADGLDIRPVSWKITDIDADGVDEIIFASRKPDLRFGVCSVDDIPDDGAGTETWTMEYSMNDVTYGADNKWDVAVIGSNAYLFDEVKISKVSWDGSTYGYSEMDPLPGGVSFDAAQVCDVDDDGNEEILTAEYAWGSSTPCIWLLQEEGDTLKHTALFDLVAGSYIPSDGRVIGGDQGDIDGDGNVDFIFGTRYSNASLLRLEYKGSGTITDPANWELTYADTAASASGGMWNVIDICNVDDDAEDEVVYTSSVSSGSFTYPIIILDGNEYTTDIRDILTPTSFELGEAYPNPFNPATIIPFTLEESGIVTLTVFNVKGERVSTLISSDRMESGHHNVMFDASDLASGVYVYQLQVDNTVRAAKMVLNK
ncbi:MAG: T9SS type A sorting domain-containing protein [Candidatus Marinimicrobia bacterium]|nr:T9SS type A sorting domain-containing protein [Candidatus Neomarinimicrobiota bacterium]